MEFRSRRIPLCAQRRLGVRRGVTISSDEGCRSAAAEGSGELKRLRRPKVMHAQEPHGSFADWVARIDLVPRLRELPQSVECLRRRRIVKSIVAFEARKRWRDSTSVARHRRIGAKGAVLRRLAATGGRLDHGAPQTRAAETALQHTSASMYPAVLVRLIGYRS